MKVCAWVHTHIYALHTRVHVCAHTHTHTHPSAGGLVTPGEKPVAKQGEKLMLAPGPGEVETLWGQWSCPPVLPGGALCTPGPKAQLGAHPWSPEPSLTESLPEVSTMRGSDTAPLGSAPFSGSPSPAAGDGCTAPSQGTPEGELCKGKSALRKRLLCPIFRVGDKCSCPSPLVLGHPRMCRRAHGRATPSIPLWARAGGFQERWKEGWLGSPMSWEEYHGPLFPLEFTTELEPTPIQRHMEGREAAEGGGGGER